MGQGKELHPFPSFCCGFERHPRASPTIARPYPFSRGALVPFRSASLSPEPEKAPGNGLPALNGSLASAIFSASPSFL